MTSFWSVNQLAANGAKINIRIPTKDIKRTATPVGQKPISKSIFEPFSSIILPDKGCGRYAKPISGQAEVYFNVSGNHMKMRSLIFESYHTT